MPGSLALYPSTLGGIGTLSQHFRRLRQKDCLSPGVRDQPGQHSRTRPCLYKQKISKLAGHGGAGP